jgi:purine-cytosine permease-like protein
MAAVAGLSLALTLVTSMLPLLMVVVLVAYFFTLRRRQLVIPFFIGGLVGLTPLLLYNFLCFGSPFLLPNLAGDYRDTFFRLNPSDFIEKLRFYVRILTNYVPVFWLGIVGLLLFLASYGKPRPQLQ